MSTCPDHHNLHEMASVPVADGQLRREPEDSLSARDQLLALSAAASDASWPEMAECAAVYADLLDIITGSGGTDDNLANERDAIATFVQRGLQEFLSSQSHSSDLPRQRIHEAYERWGEYLELVRGPSVFDLVARERRWSGGNVSGDGNQSDRGDQDNSGTESSDQKVSSPEDQARLLLAALQAHKADERQPLPSHSKTTNQSTEPSKRLASVPVHLPRETPRATRQPAGRSIFDSDDAAESTATRSDHGPDPVDDSRSELAGIDPEILEAFQDDTRQCLAAMERASLDYEREPENPKHLRQLCRELHTLKGASASIGWKTFARRLHEWEEALQAATARNARPQVEQLFAQLDAVRQEVQSGVPGLRSELGEGASPDAVRRAVASAPSVEICSSPHVDEETVRVKAAQLDRLMDTLSELVMLRNRRHARAQQLKSIQSRLAGVASRVRDWGHGTTPSLVTATEGTSCSGSPRDTLEAIEGELLAAARALREVSEPLNVENDELSQCIRQLRQDLVELRRLPVVGLFQRLERAVRDAARTEGKQVQIRFVGEQTGLERSLQERLYEPLLHIVRNAVSHGIEAETDRRANGKTPYGNVTLEARGGTNLLVLTVQDDGKGLDYDALRRRGKELGLLSSDRPATRDELSQLIFRSGFSTRSQASQVSGRGVGMDVVAATLDRLHGWVEVDSTAGQGTQIRLLIPRRSVIEHAMVFRCRGRLFALPMQAVHEARDDGDDPAAETIPADLMSVHLGDLLEKTPASLPENPRRLVLGATARTTRSDDRECARVALWVDEIIGPQEVVVRPLPHLLSRHRLLAGVSLSATGEIVLLLDAQRLADLGVRRSESDRQRPVQVNASQANDGPTMLVVDDSRANRQLLIQVLTRRGIRVDEAIDGRAALELLQHRSYTLVWLDVEMPRMTGLELLEVMRRTPTMAQQPVVMASSRMDESIRARAAELGVFDYLFKPLAEEQVNLVCERVAPATAARGKR